MPFVIGDLIVIDEPPYYWMFEVISYLKIGTFIQYTVHHLINTWMPLYRFKTDIISEQSLYGRGIKLEQL